MLVGGGFPIVDGVVTAFDPRAVVVALASYALPYAEPVLRAAVGSTR